MFNLLKVIAMVGFTANPNQVVPSDVLRPALQCKDIIKKPTSATVQSDICYNPECVWWVDVKNVVTYAEHAGSNPELINIAKEETFEENGIPPLYVYIPEKDPRAYVIECDGHHRVNSANIAANELGKSVFMPVIPVPAEVLTLFKLDKHLLPPHKVRLDLYQWSKFKSEHSWNIGTQDVSSESFKLGQMNEDDFFGFS